MPKKAKRRSTNPTAKDSLDARRASTRASLRAAVRHEKDIRRLARQLERAQRQSTEQLLLLANFLQHEFAVMLADDRAASETHADRRRFGLDETVPAASDAAAVETH